MRCVVRSSRAVVQLQCGREGGWRPVTKAFVLIHVSPIILILVDSAKSTEHFVEEARLKTQTAQRAEKYFK